MQGQSSSDKSSLFHLRFFNTPDAPSSHFLSSTDVNTDLTIFVALESGVQSLRSAFPLPTLKLLVRYNQLLFRAERVECLIDQLIQLVIDASRYPDRSIGCLDVLTAKQISLLPDPTSDLHWSDFKGSIQDIFSLNANRHPDRLCVIETPTFLHPRKREFKYRQINEASNVLGHHLIAKGVSRGDVIMVYAHRGVDLVISVMGILKAGAAFSVIGSCPMLLSNASDPAYPPARQTVYLNVAKPAALIVIENAGELSPSVKQYIGTQLTLKCYIPALALRDDGVLIGDRTRDLFGNQIGSRSESPGVTVGPDSTPTLSFTSGSEGVPKGVRGRHFSLTYYFPWMAETFGLSDSDHFTMLSGIAHDPIQRDSIFLTRHYLTCSFYPFIPGRDLVRPVSRRHWNPRKVSGMDG
jgi:L-2-aminoadipate reductase